MKRYLKEIIILLLQIFMYYIFPLFAGPTDMMGLVLLLVLSTFVLSLILAMISDHKLKYGYPLINALIFIPTIPIYYNSSAIIHILWYFLVSLVGFILGEVIYQIIIWRRKYENKRTKN